MCGRYTVARIDRLIGAFPKYRFPGDARPQYNIAPTQPVLVLRNDGTDAVEWLRWGLIPAWTPANEPLRAPLFNARIETLTERAAWKRPLRERRCLIFADGFYEWRREGAAKEPIYFQAPGGVAFAFAGLWDRWHPHSGPPIDSCAIITGPADQRVAPVHDRMPLILPESAFEEWLRPDPADVRRLIRTLTEQAHGPAQSHAVSSRVNSAANDDADLIVAVS